MFLGINVFVFETKPCSVMLVYILTECKGLGKRLLISTRRPWTLVICLTPAIGVTNGNFLQTCFIVTYGLAPLQDMRLRNLSDLEFDLSRSLKVICDHVIGLSIYAFLLMFNSNLWSKSGLYDIQACEMWVTLNLTFEGHSSSNVMMSLDSPYMFSY